MLRSPAPPWPLLEMAIEPKSKADQETLVAALGQLVAEDPSVTVTTGGEAGQLILKGNDACHLGATIESLRRTTGTSIIIGALQVAYRETIAQTAEREYTYKTSMGGRGLFARVTLRVRPTGTHQPAAFESKVDHRTVPEEYIRSAASGVRTVMTTGPLAGLPVVGVAVELLDAMHHETDSSALAFETASREAVRDALRKGVPVLLEPVMAVTVLTLPAATDTVLRDLMLRRGQVTAQQTGVDVVVIKALVPLANLFGLLDRPPAQLTGRPMATAVYDHVAPVPGGNPWEPPPAVAMALRA